ncbi:response regulator transcription factor [Desulfitobacterium chlororespirans]|uniref:response regulator transcription factor n=1 Tax=Desulfitobacterium chlororespirans TaxID=51616 RepID=UPI000932D787|nr:response regulator transcription factor [Desulfitobacterium chlororespirans]
MKILLAEDEKSLSSAIAKGLRKLGYAVDQIYDGEDALAYLEINEYDLLILDLNMPKVDGLTVLNTLRKADSELKVLILSARSEIEDKVRGLDSGANDYLAKPFDFEELTARIRNLLRWSFTYKESHLTCGGLELDIPGKAVAVGGVPVNLTNKEYSILEYLMFHMGKVVGAEEIIEHVWDSEADLFSNSFKYHMHSLKKKLSENGGDCIKNIRGQGYVIREEKADA